MLVTNISTFPIMFSTLPKTNFNFSVLFILSSACAFNFDQSRNYKELNKMFNALIHNHNFKQPYKKNTLENIVEKGENAGNQYFVLFPHCFLFNQREKSSFQQHLIYCLQMLSIWSAWKFCCLVKRQLLPKQALVFMCLPYKSWENTVGKGEIARNEQFLLFPQCFLVLCKTFFHFHQVWNCHLQTLWIWKSLKLVIWERVNKLCSFWNYSIHVA